MAARKPLMGEWRIRVRVLGMGEVGVMEMAARGLGFYEGFYPGHGRGTKEMGLI